MHVDDSDVVRDVEGGYVYVIYYLAKLLFLQSILPNSLKILHILNLD